MDNNFEGRGNSKCQLWEMRNKLEQYQKKQKKWAQQREKLTNNMVLMQQEIKKQKTINATLLKKAQHKRTCSDEQTFIFNQTNISSYFPVLLMNEKQKQQNQKINSKNTQGNSKINNNKDETQNSFANVSSVHPHSNSRCIDTMNTPENANHQSNTGTNTNTNLNLSTTSPSSNSWVPRANLRSHLDSVRTLRWQGHFLISAGEDCLLKIWDKDKLRITVREHLAPVFSLCGDQNTVFSGGAEGVVRKWMVDEFMQSGRPVSEVQLHEDSIWDMVWLAKDSLLITSSSDSSLKLIKSQNAHSLVLHSQINVNPEIPTSICGLLNQQLACGLVNSAKVQLYNIQKPHKPAQIIPFEHQSGSNFQSNKLLFYSPKNLLISGHEDHRIRLLDINSNKSIGNIVAHSDAVTSLCVRENSKKQHEIISSSHDGTVRVWDIRKWKCIHDIGVHMKKYDESLLSLAFSEEVELLAVGGADGQIKLLSPQI